MSNSAVLIRFLATVLISSALLAETPTEAHLRFAGAPLAASNRVIVEFHGAPRAMDRSVSEAVHDTLFERFRSDLAGPTAHKSAPGVPPVIHHEFRIAILGAAVEANHATVERLRNLSYVRSVVPDREVRALESMSPRPADEPVDARPGVNAGSLGVSGEGVVVSVIDTGVDYMHPALGGGFGHGFKVVGGYDFVNRDDDPMDDEGHGTHVAGTVAANAPGLLGVAPGATILAYKVLSSTGNGSDSDVIAAIERSLDPNQDGDLSDRADVINLSLGRPGDAEDPVSRAVDAAVAAGTVVVVAGGNSGGTATIGSPGTAPHAITVAAIDSEMAVTSFSSRGPSPRLLGFKPDVAAPGYAIPSTRMGGGILSLSGTSMASPHVAGVAALLVELHPEWDPATVKSAIVSSAAAVADKPFARGAGRVDARAAHESGLHRDQSGISFGLRASRAGSSTESRTVRFTNRSAGIQSITIDPGSALAGVVLRVEPSTLEIPPGESREVTIELEANHELLEYPYDALAGGDLVVSGTSSMTIPWGLLRTARARITYDGLMGLVVMANSDGAHPEAVRIGGVSEFFVPPGRKWDLIVEGYDPVANGEAPDVRRVIVRQDVQVDADESFEISGAEASLELILDPRDRSGAPLGSGAAGGTEPLHLVGIRLLRQVDGSDFSLASLGLKESLRRTLYSPLSDRFKVYQYEHYVDFHEGEAYAIEYETLTGLDHSRTLTNDGDDLTHVLVRSSAPPLQSQALTTCSFEAVTTRFSASFASCFRSRSPEDGAIDYYTNGESSPFAYSGMMFGTGTVLSQVLRGRDGEIVISSDREPGPLAHRIPGGGTYAVAAGPAFPFELPGTTTGFWFGTPTPGFYGSGGELIAEQEGSRWTAFNATGDQIGTGLWRGGFFSSSVPLPTPGARIVIERGDLEGYGRFGRGVLDVRFGTSADDLIAPTLTSLRVLDATGATRSTLVEGEQAWLHFSIADADFPRGGETKPSKPQMTRAWAKGRGDVDWQSLPVVITGSETGSHTSLRHFPAGDIYMADLGPVVGKDGRWIDIRLEFEDAAGNRVSWTNEMAFAVGDPTRPRRRSVR